MEDFDIFTDEIEFSRPAYKNILRKFVRDIPRTPSGPNYESGRKLLAEECLIEGNDSECAFHLCEAASSSLRTLAVYRDDQLQNAGNKLQKIITYIKPIKDIIDSTPSTRDEDEILNCLLDNDDMRTLKQFETEDVPLHKKYLKHGSHNNVHNFLRILKDLPKEWTVIQLTTPFDAKKIIKSEIDSVPDINMIFLTLLTNNYLGDYGPLTVTIPANTTQEQEKPVFEELYHILLENYTAIEDVQFSNKKLFQKYWERRTDIDLRMKSVLNVMFNDWLGGWSSLLTGRLIDKSLRDKLVNLVDKTVKDWGFIKLTKKQKILLYNLLESSAVLSKKQTRACLIMILTEHGDIDEIREALRSARCASCSTDFLFTYELCLQCLIDSFERIHHINVQDCVDAFLDVAARIEEDWSELKDAKRYPVILIVDELIDSFPWENLPILAPYPVTRVENIHFLYALYKTHQREIIDGYFCAKSDVGKFIINPEQNLQHMENRMSVFLKYWCQSWSGHIGEAPSPEDFFNYITKSDIFLYCGHGDGWQLANGTSSTSLVGDGRCVALLSGCGSVRLAKGPGRAPPSAAHHHLHLVSCPVVLGMLWEVTDYEVDKMISMLLSLYVPTDAPVDWVHVDKTMWSSGKIDPNKSEKTPPNPECDLLKAICRARSATKFAMIACSLVARGLPVRSVHP